MKKHNLIYCSLLLFAGALSSCKKGDHYEPTAEFQFVNSGAKYVTTDVTVNPKDSVNFQFTVTSTSDMAKIILQKGVANTDTLTVPAASKNSFSGIKKAVADSVTGTYSYTFTAYDAAGYRLGTSSITVTVTSDYNYFTNRVLFVPDTTAKTNQAYFSTSTGKTYSYSGGAANSTLIDFGYYYDTTTANKHTIYALNSNPISFYDLSSWTGNATVFKRLTTVTMASLTSSGALRTAGVANLASGTTSKITALVAGNVILFKTAAGKYGAISIAFINQASPAASTYMNIDVKVQK